MTVPAEVSAYLKAATCLLPPGSRGAVRAELHAHLHQAMLDHLTAGGAQPDAWAAALQGLGPAGFTAWGLARVHTLPLLLRVVLTAGALGGAASALWTHSADRTSADRTSAAITRTDSARANSARANSARADSVSGRAAPGARP